MVYVLRIVSVIMLAIITIPGSRSAVAAGQADTPFADLGLPEIAVTITDTAIETDATALEAGRYVLTVTNATEEAELGVGFLQPPDDMTAQELVELLAGMAGPPDASPAASPAGDEEGGAGDGPPPFYYEVPMAGGIYAVAGASASTVLDLTAGEWLLWTEDPAAAQAPVIVSVTGEPPADPPTPEADVIVTGVEMAFEIEGEFVAGPQVIAFVNGGEQPHFLVMLKVPEGTTAEDFLALAAGFGDPTATPPPGLSFEDITTGVDTADQSAGVTTWIAADLEPGSYILACFVQDPETGAPHAMLGMIDEVVIPA